MSTFLIRSATSQSTGYPIVLTRMRGSVPAIFKIVKVPAIEPATSWFVVKHADPLTNEAVRGIENNINDNNDRLVVTRFKI